MSEALNSVTIPEDILKFYSQLAEIQEGLKKTLKVLPIELDKGVLNQHAEQKVPLMNFVKLNMSTQDLEKSINEITRFMAENKEGLVEDIEKIKLILVDMAQEPVDLVETVLWQKDQQILKIIEENNLNKELFSVLIVNIVKPFIVAHAEQLQVQLEELHWLKRYCPVCGWEPSLAINSKDNNKRLLHCSFCETEWFFKKLQCPKCDCEDFAKLKTLKVADQESYELATCEECKGYIKVVNEKNSFGKKNMSLEDVKTLYLDILAEREGFSKESKKAESSNLS